MTNETIEMYRKDTPTIQITVYDYTGSTAFDLTDYTIQLMAKKDVEDKDSAAVLTSDGNITNPTGGVAQFDMTEALTSLTPGNYTYDIQIKNSSTSKVYTVSKGTLTIIRDIRRAGN